VGKLEESDLNERRSVIASRVFCGEAILRGLAVEIASGEARPIRMGTSQ